MVMESTSRSPLRRCHVFEEGPRALRIDALCVGYQDVDRPVRGCRASTHSRARCRNHPQTHLSRITVGLLAILCEFGINLAQLKRPESAHENSLIPLLSSSSSSTLYVFSLSDDTPCRSSTCIAARENPHMGVSGVPFMNNTTGLEETAFWIWARASFDSSLEK